MGADARHVPGTTEGLPRPGGRGGQRHLGAAPSTRPGPAAAAQCPAGGLGGQVSAAVI